MESSSRKRWNVYSIRKRQGLEKPFWLKVGVAFVNGDGSVNLYLDAMPLDGKLQMREWKEEANAPAGSHHGLGNGASAEAEEVEAF